MTHEMNSEVHSCKTAAEYVNKHANIQNYTHVGSFPSFVP